MKCDHCKWDEQPDNLTHLKRTVEACMNTGPCLDRDPVVVWREDTFVVLDPSEVILEDNKKKKLMADTVIDLPLVRHLAPPPVPVSALVPDFDETFAVETAEDGSTTTEEVTIIPE